MNIEMLKVDTWEPLTPEIRALLIQELQRKSADTPVARLEPSIALQAVAKVPLPRVRITLTAGDLINLLSDR